MCVCVHVHVGFVYLYRCPVNGLIPIWLIIFGLVCLIQTTINVSKRCCYTCKCGKEVATDYGGWVGSCIEFFITAFLIAWIICGSVWVFQLLYSFKENDCMNEVDSDLCCHPVPYLFSYVTLLVIYTVGALVLCCCCCCVSCFTLQNAGSHIYETLWSNAHNIIVCSVRTKWRLTLLSSFYHIMWCMMLFLPGSGYWISSKVIYVRVHFSMGM